jgi:hypothetical protein
MNLKELNKLGIVWNYERKNKNNTNMEYKWKTELFVQSVKVMVI